jgi:hypothetical protein
VEVSDREESFMITTEEADVAVEISKIKESTEGSSTGDQQNWPTIEKYIPMGELCRVC